MVVVPAEIPEANPVVAPIVATTVLELLHVPPPVASVSVPVVPVHKFVGPAIGSGAAFTVTLIVVVSD